MRKKGWQFWTAIISAVTLGLDWVEHIVHVLHFLSDEAEITLAVVSAVIFLISSFLDMRKKIEEQAEVIRKDAAAHQDKITDIVSAVHEDVVRKLLGIKIGEDIMELLLQEARFPLTLVPGGDVALSMNQQGYADTLRNCVERLGKGDGWHVDWTTFVPFESLNRALAYTDHQWQDRLKDGLRADQQNLDFRCDENNKYYHGINHWNSIQRPRQIIILTNPASHRQHPLNWRKYATPMEYEGLPGGSHHVDLVKYLIARYGKKSLEEFIDMKESAFEIGRAHV